MRNVWVVVLGDFGRSPRMQNHAASLAQQRNVRVNVVASKGAVPPADVMQYTNLTLHGIPEIPQAIAVLPRVLRLLLKATWQLVALLLHMLFWLPRPQLILLQVPPAVPILAVCVLVAWLRGAKLVVDWHNFGYTLMALQMGRRHPLVLLARRFERNWGRAAHGHLCVTKAMQRDLQDAWRIRATVFYDRPPTRFRPASLQETHELMLRLAYVISSPLHPRDICSSFYQLPDGSRVPQESTPVTEVEGGQLRMRADRPAIIVSSTSWTPDEDFSILLKAAQLYDQQAVQGQHPPLLIIVTGSGPLKSHYLSLMKALDLRHVAFRTGWLEAADYPLLLGSADIGVSLHSSSSGLDLPMKVVDMFGCGLPVCALGYQCITELVAPGKNGLLFSSAEELARQLLQLLQGFPVHQSQLQSMRHVVEASMAVRWDDSWTQVVWPKVEALLPP